MKQELLQDYDHTIQQLVEVLCSFTQEQININPFEGSWSAAQVAEHIIRYESGVLKTLHGPAKPSEREPYKKVELLRKTFLDLNTKYPAPGFLEPSTSAQQKETLVSGLERKKAEIGTAIQSLNLSETCLAFELPGAGALTRLEWVYFIVYHTQRHTRQLENIHQKITGIQARES